MSMRIILLLSVCGLVGAAAIANEAGYSKKKAAHDDARLPAAAPKPQTPIPPPIPDGIRVIDIKLLLEANVEFQTSMASLKEKLAIATKVLQAERNAIVKLEERTKKATEGNPEYKRLYDELARRKADFAVIADRQQREFREREAEILGNAYGEIQSAVKTYCERNNVGLVIYYNSEPVDMKTHKSVIQAVSRPLIYVQPQRDITPMIRDMLAHRVALAPQDPPR